MFEKRFASENATAINKGEQAVRTVFAAIGRDEASEIEIVRAARTLGVTLGRLGDVCESTGGGRYRLKGVNG